MGESGGFNLEGTRAEVKGRRRLEGPASVNVTELVILQRTQRED